MDKLFKLPSEQLFRLVNDARERTQELVRDLADEQMSLPMMEIVNPFCWELGQVAFFYDVFLLRILGTDRFLLEGAENLYDSFRDWASLSKAYGKTLSNHDSGRGQEPLRARGQSRN